MLDQIIRNQRAVIHEQAERIRQLEAALYGWEWEPPLELRLTPCQARMVQALVAASGRVLTREFLIDATRRTPRAREVYPDLKMMDTVICKMRERFRPYGLSIATVHGRGFRIDEETRQRLLTWPPSTASSSQQSAAAAA